MSTYKLIYFDLRGKGELARLILTYQGQEYEDSRFSMDQWPEIKPKMPFGQVPVLEVDGKMFSESVAINNFLARKFGLYGSTDFEMVEVDQVVGITQDMWKVIVDWVHENDETKKAALQKENEEKNFPKYLDFFEKILKTNDTGFYVGNQLSYADLAVFDALDIEVPDSVVDRFPLVKANRERVRTNDKLKDYIASRKEATV
ncbi:probable glutathione S-transferase 6 [Haliotis rufescens]|uniref:probable glutathione S-transferase 6 n=1 Tax=Haliotis rufescens TaxID=6454 RepID=UPI00201EB203|nr:probable glutathione S-transferase 6 [Haliotis rufescens]